MLNWEGVFVREEGGKKDNNRTNIIGAPRPL